MISIKRYKTQFGNICCLPNDCEFTKALSSSKMYEEDLVLEHIIPLFNKSFKYVILDVGAHIGSHSIIYSKSIPNCKIISFEPQSIICDILNKNTRDNNIQNCTIYNNAIGHKIMRTTMTKYLSHNGHDTPIEYSTNNLINYAAISLGEDGENVNMVTIDSLKLKQCDFIKMDIGGAAILVLMGAVKTIQKFLPIIFFEENGLTVTDEMIKSLNIDFEYDTPRNFLTKLGYNITKVPSFYSLAIHPNA